MAGQYREKKGSWLGAENFASVDDLLWSFLISVSRALDLSYAGVMSHHMRVAVIAAKISRALGLSQERFTLASQAALIHDLGVKTWGDRARLHQFEVDDPYQHALDGYRILTGARAHEALSEVASDGAHEPRSEVAWDAALDASCRAPHDASCRAVYEAPFVFDVSGDAKTAEGRVSLEGQGRKATFFPHAVIILHHHDRWQGGNPTEVKQDAIPIESRIIHLADRMDVLLDEGRPFNSQKEEILGILEGQRARTFDPELIDIVKDLAKSESFWFDLEPRFLPKSLEACVVGDLSMPVKPGAYQPLGEHSAIALKRNESQITDWDDANMPEVLKARPEPSSGSASSSLDTLEVLSWVFAEVVDRRSPYTYRHSRSVGGCAFAMSKYLGFDPLTCREIRVAGLLHDLGKMGVSEDILDKKGSLSEEEICIVKRHPYLTYHLLDDIPGFGRIKKWASFHHERMDGQGYPFRLDSSALSLEARIIAVCDVFSALSEDRPYRAGLSREEVQRILTKMAGDGALDKEMVDLAGKVLVVSAGPRSAMPV